MTVLARCFALALLLPAASPAIAEPATPDGAARLTSVFETYLGSTPGVVSVVPDNESYRATFDFNPIFALGAAEGLTGTVTPMELVLTDQGDGKWGVAQDQAFELALDLPDALTLDMRAETWRWNGVFDETLQAFVSSEGETTGLRVAETLIDPAASGMEIVYTIEEMTFASSAGAGSSGGVDSRVSYSARGIVETIRAPDGEETPLPISATIKLDTYDLEGGVKGMRSKDIYALLAWIVAHPSEAAVQADLAGLSEVVDAALPFFEAVNLTGDITDISVVTPFGAGGADGARIAVDMNGVVPDGYVREMISFKGLSLPEELMPEWVPPLLPRDATLDFAVEGFDLATPAGILLERLAKGDVKSTPEGDAALLQAFLPDGKVRISMGPGGIASGIYDVDFNGSVEAGPAEEPHGSAVIGARGIEAVLEALNDAPDDVRQGAVPALMMMRGIARPEAEGRFVWNIEVTPEKKVIVNDIDLSALTGKQ